MSKAVFVDIILLEIEFESLIYAYIPLLYGLVVVKVIAPVCINKSKESTTSQCSIILSFFILYRSADLIFTGLFVGGIPSNCPLCIPEKLRNTRTKSFSASICSILHVNQESPKGVHLRTF